MENASKALLIAGGILLSLLILSLLVMLLSSISSSKLTEEEKLAAKELKEFNDQWEAYNKKVLYGTDLISVVNKAIDNNKKMDLLDITNRYYVNIHINFKSETFTTEIEELDKRTSVSRSVSEATVTEGGTSININDRVSFAREINLGNWNNTPPVLKMNNRIVQAFAGITKYKDAYDEGDKIYYVTSAYKKFKTKIFKCTSVDYADGRVHQLNFEIKD